MDWKQYEREVRSEVRSLYPTSSVSFDKKIRGQFSQIDRQCDVLLEEKFGKNIIRTLYDAKFHRRKIDVKHVEEFIGLLKDVGCERGVIVAKNGFTRAASNLALNGPDDLDLDILNFEDLRQFQGVCAIPYSGSLGLILRSPFGWVVDAERRCGAVASFYRRGQSFEEALRTQEYMYLNFWHLEDGQSLGWLLRMQEQSLMGFFQDAIDIQYDEIEDVKNKPIKLRIVTFKEKDHIEISGFREIRSIVLFFVMHTPKLYYRINRKKLIHILTMALPIGVTKKRTPK